MKEIRNIGLIGLGQRGTWLLKETLLLQPDVNIVALCDVYEDRCEDNAKVMEDMGKPRPACYTDYKDVIASDAVDTVLVTSAWESHIEIAIAAMEAGKPVGFEVGGAYSMDQLWQLVRTYERTKVPCAMLENAIYERKEMLALNMVRHGLFGELVNCCGGYRHDIRDEISFGRENRHYRFRNYLNRNADNYPTHDLGPITGFLDLNHGNRMLSLVSMASKARGLHEFIVKEKGEDYDGAQLNFAQGDVVTTLIKCAHGETITLTLDTCLPRAFSADIHVQGTKGLYDFSNNSVFLDGDVHSYDAWKQHWNNAETFYAEYDHPLRKAHDAMGAPGGHEGADWLTFRAFIDGVKENRSAPVDVYDAASWMSVTLLTEQSIAMGSMPVAVPDFTNGKWMERPRWNP